MRLIAGAIDHFATSTSQFSFTFQHSGLKECFFFFLKLPKGWMFSKVKLSSVANSSLNLAETKFYEVGLAPPYWSWVCKLQISSSISRPLGWLRDASSLKCALEPRLLTEILLFWSTLNISWAWLTNAPMPQPLTVFGCVMKAKFLSWRSFS